MCVCVHGDGCGSESSPVVVCLSLSVCVRQRESERERARAAYESERDSERERAATRAFYCSSLCLLHFCCLQCCCCCCCCCRCLCSSGFSSFHATPSADVAAPSSQLPVASCQFTHARTRWHFHFVFVASAPAAAALATPCTFCLLLSPLSFGVRLSVSVAARRRCFCSGFMTFFCQRTPCHLTHSRTHTHVAGSVSQPPRHLSPAPSARLSVSDACRCRRCLLLLLLPCSHSHSASLLLLRFVLVAALTALPRRRCSASALPRSRSRYRSLSRFRSLSRSRRQPLTSVKLNSKYYFLDTLLSGRRRVKQTSCSIRQPAIDRAGHIESGLQQQQRRRTQALFELWLQLESRSRCSLFSFGVGQQETEPGVASSALSNCE